MNGHEYELMPCPFCGSHGEISVGDEDSMFAKPMYNPHCGGRECYCDLGYYETLEEAVAVWNMRYGMSEQRENHLLRSALANVQIIIEELSSQLHYSTVRQEKRK